MLADGVNKEQVNLEESKQEEGKSMTGIICDYSHLYLSHNPYKLCI